MSPRTGCSGSQDGSSIGPCSTASSRRASGHAMYALRSSASFRVAVMCPRVMSAAHFVLKSCSQPASSCGAAPLRSSNDSPVVWPVALVKRPLRRTTWLRHRPPLRNAPPERTISSSRTAFPYFHAVRHVLLFVQCSMDVRRSCEISR